MHITHYDAVYEFLDFHIFGLNPTSPPQEIQRGDIYAEDKFCSYDDVFRLTIVGLLEPRARRENG